MPPTCDEPGSLAGGRDTDQHPILLGGAPLGHARHICAFFNSREDEYRVLSPYIKEGLESGEKAYHVVDPARCEEHLRRLEHAGIDATVARGRGQLELHDWCHTHLIDGRFNPGRTLGHFQRVVEDAKDQGYPLIRFLTHMEWAATDAPGVGSLLEYEARANDIWLRQEGPVNPVICIYDLAKFPGDIVVDVMRTHPMIIIGGILQENPFFVSPDEFLRGLRKRGLAQTDT